MQIPFKKKDNPKNAADLSDVINTCPACGRQSGGEVCMHCGESLYPERITFVKILKDVPDVFFDVDKGLFYTMRTFFTHPGREIKRYFSGDRNKHYKPLKYILLIGGLTTFIYAKFIITDGATESAFEKFGTQWNSLILLIQLPLIACMTWLLFKKRSYTYGEHLVANAYIIAQVSIFNIALFPIYYLLNGTSNIIWPQLLYIVLILFYYCFAFYDWFYDKKGKQGLILSFVFVFVLLLFVLIFTFVIQAVLFYFFLKLGWA